MGDLPGPEKQIDWSTLLGEEKSVATASRPTYSPERVRPRHRIAVMLHEAGWKSGDIAKALGYTEARVSVILNSHNPHLLEIRTKFAAEVADNIHDVHERMQLYANEMLDTLVHHARNKENKPELSRLAARDILHMAGFTPVKKNLNLDVSKVPVETLKQLMPALEDANEVKLRQDQWSIKNVGQDGKGANGNP